LHEQDRELLTLSHWEELAPAEIAVVLGLSAVTLRSRLHRARRRLRAELARGEVAAAPTRPPTPILERTEC
jgi:RNA polymerase sigma-70 factor (ECF subfamily)